MIEFTHCSELQQQVEHHFRAEHLDSIAGLHFHLMANFMMVLLFVSHHLFRHQVSFHLEFIVLAFPFITGASFDLLNCIEGLDHFSYCLHCTLHILDLVIRITIHLLILLAFQQFISCIFGDESSRYLRPFSIEQLIYRIIFWRMHDFLSQFFQFLFF